MSPTFSEASTNSVQSAESADANKHPKQQVVQSKSGVESRFGLDADVLSDRREEDGERLLSLDLDDSIDEHEQLEQEEMLLDDSSRSEEIGGGSGDDKEKRGDAEEEISVMDFIAETSLHQQSIQMISTPKSNQHQLPQLNNTNNNDFQSTSIDSDTKDNIQVQAPTCLQQPTPEPEDIPNSSSSGAQTINNNNQIDTLVNTSTTSTGLSDSLLSVPEQTVDSQSTTSATVGVLDDATAAANSWLGKEQPIWIPDIEALNCLHCDMKFTVIKRRHHCRACGLVLCSRCCNAKFRLEYLNNREARVCTKCHEILLILYPSTSAPEQHQPSTTNTTNVSEGIQRQPNPNNPMDYCSTVPPPLQQQLSGGGAAGGSGAATGGGVPSVMVPVGVLKRNGSTSGSKKSSKSVMFCDGIRPGSDLTNLDQDFNYNMTSSSNSGRRSPGAGSNTSSEGTIGSASGDGGSPQLNQLTGGHKILSRLSGGVNQPDVDKGSKSFIPASANGLPPKVTVYKSDISYSECSNSPSLMETLKSEPVTFAIQRNLYVNVKIVNMSCCINKTAWCFSTEGMMSVGQDEILILLETIENETAVPKDVFYHFNDIYLDAVKGQTVAELGVSLHNHSNFLESKSHVGFLYIRPTFQCLQNLIIPKESYLIGILIHRWETPWAKVFPLRLVLRLGAEYRYYPSPIISTRHRDSVFVEIGHTIINILADFRNFSYSLPHIRGLSILMEEKNTTISIPVNRYDQVMKTLNNSSEHILAFGGNFSSQADSHLVCIQNKNGTSENTYTTHAININHKPRKITGASYIVFNGALKSTSGLTAKSSIVEDGLMIQIHPEEMIKVRDSLRQMRDHVIRCGPIAAPPPTSGGDVSTAASGGETVMIKWGEADVCFNLGVKSLIDDTSMSGVPSIRVHQGKDFVCNSGSRFIRWTEVFILQNGEENNKTSEPVDVSKVASDIARATCAALVKYLDLLASNNFYKVGIRTNLHIENVSYSAGSNGIKLPPIYMKSLDNELIPVLHRITASNSYASAVVLELVFRILNAVDSAVPQHLAR